MQTASFILDLFKPGSGVIDGWWKSNSRAFVACFCSTPDLLSQWRAYGGNEGGGYAIGLRPPGALPAWGQSLNHGLVVRRVEYDEIAQRRACEGIVRPLLDLMDASPGADDVLDDVVASLVDALGEVALAFKHPAFSEEKEWRLGYYPATDPVPSPVEHRVASGLLVPYVALPAHATVGSRPDMLPIFRVECGPHPDPARKRRGVEALIDQLGLSSSVTVTSSASPARL